MSAWRGLDDDVARIVARLRPLGREIGRAAQGGDALAADVVRYYSMLHQRIDPMASYLTEKALDAWLAANNVKREGASE